MPSGTTVRLARRGSLTLPKPLRATYHLEPGDELTIIDIGGAILIKPGANRVRALADRISSELERQGESLESMLAAVREVRDGESAD